MTTRLGDNLPSSGAEIGEEGKNMSTPKAVTLLYSPEIVTYPAACISEASPCFVNLEQVQLVI